MSLQKPAPGTPVLPTVQVLPPSVDLPTKSPLPPELKHKVVEAHPTIPMLLPAMAPMSPPVHTVGVA